jgi:hypothetical protein
MVPVLVEYSEYSSTHSSTVLETQSTPSITRVRVYSSTPRIGVVLISTVVQCTISTSTSSSSSISCYSY